MDHVSQTVLIFGAVASLAALIIPIIQSKGGESFQFQLGSMATSKTYGISLIPYVILYALAGMFQLQIASGWSYFLVGAILPWILSGFRLSAPLRGILLFILTVLLTKQVGEAHASVIASLLLGLTAWKISDIFQGDLDIARWEDMTPTLCWLVASYWIGPADAASESGGQLGMVLGAISLSLFLRTLQSLNIPALKHAILGPVILTLCGGIGAMLLIRNVLLLPDTMKFWACLYGGGILLGSVVKALTPAQSTDESGTQSNGWNVPELPRAIYLILMIGLGTLVATRLFGTLGMVMVAVSGLALARPGILLYGILFWLARTLIQAYSNEFNLNVSGINLSHQYVSAALFAGVTLFAIIPPLFREWQSRGAMIGALLGLGVLVPVSAVYFLHAEATASLLIASLVMAFAVTTLGTVLYGKTETPIQNHLLWLPLQMASMTLCASELLETGDFASRKDQLMTLGAVLVSLVLLAVIIFKLIERSRRKAIEISGY